MDNLHPIDRAALEPILGPCLDLIDSIHNRRRRLFALGGACALFFSAAAPWLLSTLAPLGPFQLTLIAAAALLVALTALRKIADAHAKRLRDHFNAQCQHRDLSPTQIVRAARRAHGQWFFFTALFDSDPEPKTGSEPSADHDLNLSMGDEQTQPL